MTLAYLNGEFLPLAECKISALDRGFLFGDAVYEVIPFYQGKGFGCKQHLTRLQQSLDAVDIKNPHTDLQWMDIFEQLLESKHTNHKLYLQVSRGADKVRDFPYPKACKPTVFAYATEFTSQRYNSGCNAVTTQDIRWRDCFIKSTNLLASCIASELAQRQNAAEAILHRDGFVTEGASSNVFVVKDGTVLTTPVSSRILNGITRQIVLSLLAENNIAFAETDIPLDTLKTADEIWITSSTREVAPVVKLDSEAVADGKPGRLWQKIATLYQQRAISGESNVR